MITAFENNVARYGATLLSPGSITSIWRSAGIIGSSDVIHAGNTGYWDVDSQLAAPHISAFLRTQMTEGPTAGDMTFAFATGFAEGFVEGIIEDIKDANSFGTGPDGKPMLGGTPPAPGGTGWKLLLKARENKLISEGAKKLSRFKEPKPAYIENPAHVPGRGLRPGKTPLPNDAEDVLKNAVPNDSK